jgi:hypothetical protein
MLFMHLDDAMDNRHVMSCEKKGGEGDKGGVGEDRKRWGEGEQHVTSLTTITRD